MKNATITAKQVFENYRILNITDSMVSGISIYAAEKSVNPRDAYDDRFQAANSGLFVTFEGLAKEEVNALCVEHIGVELKELKVIFSQIGLTKYAPRPKFMD